MSTPRYSVFWSGALSSVVLTCLLHPVPHRDFDSLDEQNVEKNNQLAFDIAEKELGISPIMTGREMASVGEPDKLSMVMYLTQFYEMFKDSLPSRGEGPQGCWVGPCGPCSIRPASLQVLPGPPSDPPFGQHTWKCGVRERSHPESCPFLSEPASLKSAFAVTWAFSLPCLCGTLQPSLCSGQTVLRSHGESPNAYPSPFSPLRHLAVPCCSVLRTTFVPLKLCLALGFCDPGPHLPHSRSSVTVPSLAALSFPAF